LPRAFHPLLYALLALVSGAFTPSAKAHGTSLKSGNGERMIVARGDDGRMDGRRLYKLADGTNISHLTYGYDADDNITRITDRLNPELRCHVQKLLISENSGEFWLVLQQPPNKLLLRHV
jgi:YD repeat-containing protein